MSRTKGLFEISGNFEPKTGEPFDARTLVGSVSDLTDPAIWADSYPFDGMLVAIKGGGVYQLVGTDFTDSESWVNAAGSGIEFVETLEATQDNFDKKKLFLVGKRLKVIVKKTVIDGGEEISGSWQWNKILTYPENTILQAVNFNDGETSVEITRDEDGMLVLYSTKTYYDSTGFSTSNKIGWVDDGNIDFGSTAQSVSAEFKSYITANATKVGNYEIEELAYLGESGEPGVVDDTLLLANGLGTKSGSGSVDESDYLYTYTGDTDPKTVTLNTTFVIGYGDSSSFYTARNVADFLALLCVLTNLHEKQADMFFKTSFNVDLKSEQIDAIATLSSKFKLTSDDIGRGIEFNVIHTGENSVTLSVNTHSLLTVFEIDPYYVTMNIADFNKFKQGMFATGTHKILAYEETNNYIKYEYFDDDVGFKDPGKTVFRTNTHHTDKNVFDFLYEFYKTAYYVENEDQEYEYPEFKTTLNDQSLIVYSFFYSFVDIGDDFGNKNYYYFINNIEHTHTSDGFKITFEKNGYKFELVTNDLTATVKKTKIGSGSGGSGNDCILEYLDPPQA